VNYFLSYDMSGFESAKKDAEPCPVEHIDYLLDWALYDFSKGHCESFEIYDEEGNIFFQSVRLIEGERRTA
jgi:predicted  nucleic acid-binding Zn ribbon protein